MLNRQAVAAILGEATGADRPLKDKTVSQYLVESREGGKYEKHPFPTPDGYIGRGPWWRREREQEIRDWAAARPGRGKGGGRPRKG